MPYKNRTRQLQAQANSSRKRALSNRQLINSFKVGKACVDCGTVAGEFWPECSFDFDHRDPHDKKFRLGQIAKSKVKILAEIEKCDLRCSNCHRVKTLKQKEHIKLS